MKKFLISLSLMAFAAPAFAAESQIIATVSNINDKIEAVTLTQDGVVNVVLRERHRPIVKRLSQATAQRLEFMASELANAELTTTHHVIVCMMVINPMFMESLAIAPYNQETGTWENGIPKTVLTPTSCALSSSTFPADRNAYADAHSLEDMLVAFGTEALAALN